jgi:hypothetical protein
LNAHSLNFSTRFIHTCAQLAAGAVLLVCPVLAHASGAVLPVADAAEPTTLDAEVAIAITPFGTTRWTRLTVGGSQRVLWLVPARPGAALDWAVDGWLTSLEDATSPRVAPSAAMPACDMPAGPERVAPWSMKAVKKAPGAVLVHASEMDARAHVAARGFAMSGAIATEIAKVFARGYALVSVELDADGSSVFSSPTLRISDDGGAVLPLALTGSASTSVRVTAVVIGDGPSSLPGARELDASALVWGRNSSNSAGARVATLLVGRGATWLREAATHETLFDDIVIPPDTFIEPLVASYYREATGSAQPPCYVMARTAALGAGTVGRACAPGALARVPGGVGCAPAAGAIDPASFMCGAGVDDLALALSGGVPARTFLTRLTGFVPESELGADTPIASSTTAQSPVILASRYERCSEAVTPPSVVRPGASSASSSPTAPGATARPYHYDHETSGCSGSSTTVVYEDTGEQDVAADEGCASTGSGTSTGDDGDSCGGDTSTSSTSSSGSDDDSSGWDDDDDDSSATKSDSCDCGKSTTGSSGDDSSEATPKRTSRANRRGPSPVSRYALLFVALLLPLRRHLRLRKL